jgi:hypothetical protein
MAQPRGVQLVHKRLQAVVFYDALLLACCICTLLLLPAGLMTTP